MYKYGPHIISDYCAYAYILTVPPPVIVLQASSTTVALTIGSESILDCSAHIPAAVNSSDIAVQMEWSGPNGLLMDSDNRSIENVGRGETYFSRLTLTGLRYEDSGGYQCTVYVTSLSPYVLGSSETATTLITVIGMFMLLANLFKLLLRTLFLRCWCECCDHTICNTFD